jgi:hypothetical protein
LWPKQVKRSGNRGENVSIAAAYSAYVILSPVITCNIVRIKEELMSGAPECTIFASFSRNYLGHDIFNK